MTQNDVIEMAKNAIITMLLCVSPMLIIAMLLGLLIGVIQTLTQVQEQTLVFVPKMFAIFVIMLLTLPFMIGKMQLFSTSIFDKIVSIGTGS